MVQYQSLKYKMCVQKLVVNINIYFDKRPLDLPQTKCEYSPEANRNLTLKP